MKKVMLTLTSDGDIAIEFGGDLDGVCCGGEDRELQQALKNLGVHVALKNIQCKLPNQLQIKAKQTGDCIVSEKRS